MDISTILRLNEMGKLSTADAEAELAKIFAASGMDNPTTIEEPAEPTKPAEIIRGDFASSVNLPPLQTLAYDAVKAEMGYRCPWSKEWISMGDSDYAVVARKGSANDFDAVETSSSPIGVNSGAYGIAANIKAYNTINNAVKHCGEGLDAAAISTATLTEKLSNNGRWAMGYFDFPQVTDTLNLIGNTAGTTVGFHIGFINTFDGNGHFQLFTGTVDEWCSNRCTRATYDVQKLRHTSKIEEKVDDLSNWIRCQLADYHNQVNEYRRWANTPITEAAVIEFLESTNEADSWQVKMLEQFRNEAAGRNNGKPSGQLTKDGKQTFQSGLIRGETVFALHSALTHYASHDGEQYHAIRRANKFGTDNIACSVHKRALKVQKMFELDSWKKLAAA